MLGRNEKEERGIVKRVLGQALKWCCCFVVGVVTLKGCSDTETIFVDNTPTIEFAVTAQDSKTAKDLLDICFTDAKNGWAVGTEGTIIHTSDGGTSWSTQDSKTTHSLRGVCFVSSDTGWAVGDSGTIRYTFDGGGTWELVAPSPTDANLSDVFFIDGFLGWVVGQGVISKTEDGGDNWQTTDIVDTIVFAVSFSDRNRGWAVARHHVPGMSLGVFVLRTDNGGQSWIRQGDFAGQPMEDIAFVSSLKGWIVGVGGLIYHTSNGGTNWDDQPASVDRYLHGVAFWDDLTGIVVGAEGSIRTTVNGGQSWTIVPSGVTTGLEKVTFGDADYMWIVGDGGVILRVRKELIEDDGN
jgi:photosystem II stability/assembly factor-like uncharacterized protein